jgi:hypothetical protein
MEPPRRAPFGVDLCRLTCAWRRSASANNHPKAAVPFSASLEPSLSPTVSWSLRFPRMGLHPSAKSLEPVFYQS